MSDSHPLFKVSTGSSFYVCPPAGILLSSWLLPVFSKESEYSKNSNRDTAATRSMNSTKKTRGEAGRQKTRALPLTSCPRCILIYLTWRKQVLDIPDSHLTACKTQ